MNHALLLAEAMRTPWAMAPEHLATLAQVLARWSVDRPASPEILAGVREEAAARRDRNTAVARAGNGSIAVLPLWGIITQRGNMVDDVSGPGSMSTQKFTGALRAALADDSIGGILIDIDSPGGSVFGIQELADEIFQARQTKPIVAIADSLAASAAYWIGA
ncbi:MAG TPA: hypothetical protein VGQ96_02880, partial [Candidatus Eremiobacteraceae bacterium]|nr:hypothetical protein [Candidatus Eremiobacteraceae bacterium]